jgi:hypothetical protein
MANVWDRRIITASLMCLAVGVVAGPAFAGGGIGGGTTKDGARLSSFDRRELQQIRNARTTDAATPKFEYASVSNCGSNTPGSPNADDPCAEAVLACAGNTPAQGLGPSVRLFRRTVGADGRATGGWVQYGLTCFPRDAPGARPSVTMAMVLAAFHDTAFAKASLHVQPEGNVTLVGLPTYFQIRWPRAGFEPGEVDRVDPGRMAGFGVEIRPAAQSITYVFGDGSTSGPTSSLGGPYPSGDVIKTYPHAGEVVARADVSYTGQYRVNAGAWVDIPGEVTVRGTAQMLQVKTAHARLVTH